MSPTLPSANGAERIPFTGSHLTDLGDSTPGTARAKATFDLFAPLPLVMGLAEDLMRNRAQCRRLMHQLMSMKAMTPEKVHEEIEEIIQELRDLSDGFEESTGT